VSIRTIAATLILLAWPVAAAELDDAGSLIDAGNYDEARQILDQTVQDPAQKAQSLVLLTRIYNRLEDYEQGMRTGKQAVKLLPDSSVAHYEYAVAVRTKLSKVSKMKAMFSLGTYKKELQRALELEPNNLEARQEEIGFLSNAPGFAGGDKAKAAERIAELKALDWRSGMIMQSELQQAQGDRPGMIETHEQILEKHPEEDGIRLTLAVMYQNEERWVDADAQLVVLRDTERPELARSALYQRARCRVMGEFEQDEAVSFLEQFIEETPADSKGRPTTADAFWRMGLAQEQLGERDAALTSYQRALALQPEHEEAQKALKVLKAS